MRKFLVVDLNKCVDCGICSLVCSFYKTGKFNPKNSYIKIIRKNVIEKEYITCKHCDPPHCAQACPENAIEVKNGIVVVNKAKCVGTGKCVEACPFNAIWIINGKASKCDLCGGDPKCLKACPKGAISLKEVK